MAYQSGKTGAQVDASLALADSALQPGDDAADLGSGAATDGHVLTADGSGGSAWEAVPDAYAGAASEIHAVAEKTTPVDADEVGLVDSAASWVLKKLSWANVKATLSGVFAVLAGKSGGQTLIGGTGVTDKLVLQGTSGNGTSTATALEVKVGNNGALSALNILNNGQIGIGTNAPDSNKSVHIINTIGSVNPVRIDVAGNGGIEIRRTGANPGKIELYCSTSGSGAFRSDTNFQIVTNVAGGNFAAAIFISTDYKLSVNHASPAAFLHPIGTTEQLRLGYDTSNYASFTVDASGRLTLTATGTTIFTNKVIENTVNGEGIILKSPDGTRYKLTVANGGTLSIAAA